MKKVREYFSKHFIGAQILLCLILGFVVSIIVIISNIIDEMNSLYYNGNLAGCILSEFLSGIPTTFIFAIIAFPFVLTVFEIVYLVSAARGGEISTKINSKKCVIYDFIAFAIGIVMEIIFLSLLNVMFGANWDKELVNNQLHSPISPDCLVTFAVLSALYVIGMLIMSLSSNKKRPPLVTVLCIAMMYVGVIESVLFTIQIMGMNYTDCVGEVIIAFEPILLFAFFIPLNMILILIRTMLVQIKAYEPDENRMSKIDEIPILSKCNKLLINSKNWPVAAIIMMIPLLGIVIAILALFGQSPDAAIRAYTQTANYTFSKMIPPQNVFHDEHYLCTVAAGGHAKIVKPIRMGKRHGHDVVVNRQLMIANAFEQVLEERTPNFHRIIRNFYDTYGFPIAKLIKSKTVADIVWIMMKPLEWMFLIVLYLVDVNPEDRIATQYLK